MSGFSIKGLSPEAWEAYKWFFRIKNQSPFFDDIILKDDKIQNGHYDRGEAYIHKDENNLPLTGKELKAFEDELSKVDEDYFRGFVSDGIALKAIVDGKCLRDGYQYVDCTPREISDATRAIVHQRLMDYNNQFILIDRAIYADPLRMASDKNPANPDLALAAGKALFEDKKYAESIPYFTRANAYANDSTAFDYLAKVAFEVSDLAFLKQLATEGRISHEAVVKFVFEKGKKAITEEKPNEVLKAAYVLKLFGADKVKGGPESFAALAKALPNDAKVLDPMLLKYPTDFKTDLLAAKKMNISKEPAAKPATKQGQKATNDNYLFK